MSLPRQRLLATAFSLLAALLALPKVSVAAASADTWTLVASVPAGAGSNPVFALTASPSNPALVLYGTSAGDIYRSADGGADWTRVATGVGHAVLALAFDPIEPDHVLAGTRGGGIWRSDNSGGTWHALDHGTETVRGFSFSVGLSAAATDHGVLVTHDGDTWQPADLNQASVAAVTVGSGQITAGADLDPAAKGLPLFQSADSGGSWKQLTGLSGAGSMVAALGQLGTRLLVGTNTGLYASPDGGTSWSTLSSGSLPPTDYTALAASDNHLYVASDGGAAADGGLWTSADGAQSFRSLNAPLPSVTAVTLAQSTLYVATFRPVDHATFLWSYVDDGGAPQPPPAGTLPSPHAVSAPAATSGQVADSGQWYLALVRGPELPYLAVGVGALLVVLLALVAYVRRGRV